MFMEKVLKGILIAMTMVSCSPKVLTDFKKTYPPVGTPDDVAVFEYENVQKLPIQGELLGNVRIQDTGFTNTGRGTYEKVVDIAKRETWNAGGNIMIINEHDFPDIISSIHRINALAYRADSASFAKTKAQVHSFIEDETKYNGDQFANRLSQKRTINPGVSIRAYTGIGRRTNKLNPNLNIFEKQHAKRLLNGWLYGIDGTYFTESGLGVGVRYQTLYSNSSDYAALILDNDNVEEGVLDDKVYITFFGPIFAARADSKNGKHLFIANIGLGALTYKDISTFNRHEEETTGRCLGYTCNFCYSYMMTEHLSLGADVSFTTGVLNDVKINSEGNIKAVRLEKENREGLSNLGLSVELRYTF